MKRFIYGVCVVAIMLATSLSFVSCDDYVQDEFTELRGKIGDNIISINLKIDSLRNRIDNLENGYTEAIDSINALKNNVDTLKYDVDTLKFDMARLDSIIAALQDSLNSVSTLAHKLETLVTSLDNKVDSIDSRVDSLENKVDTIGSRVTSLENIVDTIGSRVTSLEKSLQDAQKTIDELSKSINELLQSYECQITSIILQGTYNNVFGSIRLPYDIQSMLVAGHYGQINVEGGEVVFPKSVAGVTPSKSYLFQNGETNRESSGYAYFTINPNTVDIAGVKFSLVNSLDSTIGFKIDTVVPSNDKLSFGWTRAGNGLYRATISTDKTVSIDALEPRIDLNDILSVIKKAVNTFKVNKTFDLSSIAQVIFENSTDILDATAIKATWTDGFGKEKSVYTNYDMAATVMMPLSYTFDIDTLLHKLSLPHINTISDVAFDFNMDIKYSNMDTIVETTYPIVIVYNGISDTINGIADLSTFVKENNLYYASQTKEQIDELIDQIKSKSKREVDKAIDQVNDYVHKINNYINIFNNYMTRLTNRLVNIDFKHYLQPCLLISSGSHFGQVSSNSDVPTFVEGESVILTPTSYTSELIAPAMYKYLAVAHVKDLAGNEIAGVADICNNTDYNMNVPFAGKQQVVLVMPESNALYEINYQAIDWSGKTVSGTYYIQSL